MHPVEETPHQGTFGKSAKPSITWLLWVSILATPLVVIFFAVRPLWFSTPEGLAGLGWLLWGLIIPVIAFCLSIVLLVIALIFQKKCGHWRARLNLCSFILLLTWFLIGSGWLIAVNSP
jgi:hypothetical protein